MSTHPAPSRPNIVLVITDQQSAELMSCRLGNEHLSTPAMDDLAARGMLFTRAYSTNPLCVPWRNCVFTGLYSHQTGVTHNDGPQLDPERFKSMGRILREAGYQTAYSGKWHIRFDEKDESAHGFEMLYADKSRGPDIAAADAAINFIQRPHDKPFMLVVSFLNPHNICEWSRRLAGRQQRLNCGELGEAPDQPSQLPPPPSNLEPQSDEPDAMTLARRAYQVDDGIFPVAHFTELDWQKHRWGYYRMVELVDRELGRVTAALRDAGVDENTLILFTSDHGDCAGAHRWNQKTVFYDESVRVPLIVSWPGQTPAGVSEQLVNTGVDILPTILDAAEVSAEHLPGRSFLPLARGQSPADWRDHLVAQNDLFQAGEVDGLRPRIKGRMVRTQRHKYCVYDGGQHRESLVDMQQDPGEMVNLARDPSHQAILLEHRALLQQFGQEQRDDLVPILLEDNVKPRPFADSSDASKS